MKRKSYTHTSRSKKRKTRKQRGGTPLDFRVVLLSTDTISLETMDALKTVLDGVFGTGTSIDTSNLGIRYSFIGITGIPDKLTGDDVTEVVYTPPPPSFLQNSKLSGDLKLTALEGLIGDALAESGLPVSLLPPSHGVTDEVSIYYVGLCTPGCWKRYTKGKYQYQIETAKKNKGK